MPDPTDLRALLRDHMSAVYAAAVAIQERIPGTKARAAEHAAVDALAAVLPDLLADVWDEGYRAARTGEPRNCWLPEPTPPNPYDRKADR